MLGIVFFEDRSIFLEIFVRGSIQRIVTGFLGILGGYEDKEK